MLRRRGAGRDCAPLHLLTSTHVRCRELGEDDQRAIREQLAEHKCVPVFLDEYTADTYYNGFCNSVLWPLLMSTAPPTGPVCHRAMPPRHMFRAQDTRHTGESQSKKRSHVNTETPAHLLEGREARVQPQLREAD